MTATSLKFVFSTDFKAHLKRWKKSNFAYKLNVPGVLEPFGSQDPFWEYLK